jgi:hypothetical protein
MPDDDVRWMTYAEVRDALGLPSTKAALQRSRRGNWPRRLNNSDNLARVGVPASAIEGSRRNPFRNPSREASRPISSAREERDQDVTGGILPGGSDAALMARVEAAEARLAEILALTRQVVGQLDAAQQARAELEAREAVQRERAERAETQAAAERARADQAEQERAAAREEQRQAQGEVDGLKLGLEHMHEVLAQARREAAETGAKAEQAARAAKDANERLARLHSRGVWARLRNRP